MNSSSDINELYEMLGGISLILKKTHVRLKNKKIDGRQGFK